MLRISIPLALFVAACGSSGQNFAPSPEPPPGASGAEAATATAPDTEREAETPADRRKKVIAELEQRRAADPRDGMTRYTLARIYAREDRDRALAMLGELETIASWDYRLADMDFPALADDPAYRRIARLLNARAPSPEPSPVAFELDVVDIVPEGVAWDARRSELLVGSMHQRAVFAADGQGRTRPVVTAAQDGLLGVLGIAVDEQRDQLWVASTVVPFMRGFNPDQAGTSALFAFDLATGATIGRWHPPEKPSQLNDLIVLDDGSVYVTDSITGALLRRPADAKPGTPLEVVVPAGTFLGTNGIVDAADSQAVYVCDYRGIHRVELASGRRTRLAPPPGVQTLGGIDGVERHGDWLLAIQNIAGPGRVWALRLTRDGRGIESARLLDAGHPRYQGPTTGAVAGDRFLYLADAALQLHDGEVQPAAPGQRHAILSLPLP